jgi:hypothetical protein
MISEQQSRVKSAKVDKTNFMGMCISGLCIIHCILTPVAFSFLSIHFRHMYKWLDFVFIIMAAYIVWLVLPKTHKKPVKLILLGGLFLFVAGILLEGVSHDFHALMYAGSGLLVTGHLFNLYKKPCEAAS